MTVSNRPDSFGERRVDDLVPGDPTELGPTAISWWLAAVVAIVLAVISAVPLFLLFWVWFIAVPVWAVFALITAGICFAVSRSWPPALSFGIGVLGSIPFTIVIIFVFLVLSSLR